MRTRTIVLSHMIARADGLLCTRCLETEAVYCGDGTPLDSLLIGYENAARRHQNCLDRIPKITRRNK